MTDQITNIWSYKHLIIYIKWNNSRLGGKGALQQDFYQPFRCDSPFQAVSQASVSQVKCANCCTASYFQLIYGILFIFLAKILSWIPNISCQKNHLLFANNFICVVTFSHKPPVLVEILEQVYLSTPTRHSHYMLGPLQSLYHCDLPLQSSCQTLDLDEFGLWIVLMSKQWYSVMCFHRTHWICLFPVGIFAKHIFLPYWDFILL